MVIREIVEKDYGQFKELFCEYYAELDCEDDPLHLFEEYVLADLKAGLLQAAVADSGGNICGFVIYQVDDVINDWNFLEGYGDIRELYVRKLYRRQGAGRMLLSFAENALAGQSVPQIYTLPTEESEKFFISCGYGDYGEYCAELDEKVFVKIGYRMDKTDKT